jgi:uncharacterized repeat protein (TIGR03803 family)
MSNPRQQSWISAVGLKATLAVLVLMVFLLALVVCPLSQAQFKVLHTFSGGADGGFPYAGVIHDAQGNLYGTTKWGGDLGCNSGNGCGVVYKLTKGGQETVLYSFKGGTDGVSPATG